MNLYLTAFFILWIAGVIFLVMLMTMNLIKFFRRAINNYGVGSIVDKDIKEFNRKVEISKVRRIDISSYEITKFIFALSGQGVKFNDERDIEIQKIRNLVNEGFYVFSSVLSRYDDASQEKDIFYSVILPSSLNCFVFAFLRKEFEHMFNYDKELLNKVNWEITKFFMDKQYKRDVESREAQENAKLQRELYLRENPDAEIYDQRAILNPIQERLEHLYHGSRELEYYYEFSSCYDNNTEYSINFISYYEFIFWNVLKPSRLVSSYFPFPKFSSDDYSNMMKISFGNGVLYHVIAYLCNVFRGCCMPTLYRRKNGKY